MTLTMLASCACKPWHGPAVIRSRSGQAICAKHHIPLISVRGYQAPDGALVDPYRAWHDIAVCFPNHVPEYQSLVRDVRDVPLAVRITYCPVCEREVQSRWKKKDEELKKRFRERSNQAMQLTPLPVPRSHFIMIRLSSFQISLAVGRRS